MSKTNGGIWSIALPLSVLFLAAAYYVKVSEVRKEVDARTPLVRNLLGRFVPESGTRIIVMPGEQDPAFATSNPAPEPAPIRLAAGPQPVIVPAPKAVLPAPAVVLSLEKIAADPSLWPKKVTLQKPAKFPAVLNGKIVGELVAPAGSEATLKLIRNDQVGLEFNGGGAWLPAAETDLIARVQATQ
jgi:hypothetical protein